MSIKWHKIDKNPVLGVKMFPERRRERYLNGGEIAALLDACEYSKNKSLKLIVKTAIYTGGRLREILSIKVQDIDFRISKINVPHTKTGENGKLTMSTNLKEEIQEYLKGHKHEYLFCKDDGTPFNDIRDSFNGALKAAGIKNCRFHDLRHTFASHLTMKGVDSRTIQELGRWKTPSMLMRYAHLSPEHMQSAVNTLNDLFQNKHETSTFLIKAEFAKEGETAPAGF
jgi:integrase